jgi:spore germination cell wall hydrolase CwlJ-like protein
MKDAFDILLDIFITVFTIFMVVYILLSVGAYSLTAAEPQLTYEEKVVALTILGEARGEKEAGMYAVACVIQNRADKSGKKLSQVCLARKQFSVWNGKTVNDLKHLFKSPSAPYAIKLAKAMCKGYKLVQAFTGNADHYCTLKTHNYWTKKNKPVKIIGNHKFFKLN